MESEPAPVLWFILVAFGAAILGLALAYGVLAWRKRRSIGTNRARDAATHRLYESKEGSEAESRKV